VALVAQPLSPERAGRVYDRIGRMQDWQSFYEGPAIRALQAHADFEHARSVFELGCGTGAMAERLLDRVLPDDASYLAADVSRTMVGLAAERLRRFGDRASVHLVSGTPPLPGADGSFDRFVAVYVFDIFSDDLAAAMLSDAERLLAPSGTVCLVSLGAGRTRPSRALCSVWNAAWRVAPALVGGCRPVDLVDRIPSSWEVMYATDVTSFAVTSQVVVARPGSSS
jgi:ubiquinone/menaquinone biosynthesis C-methylase UbiE